MAFDGLPLAQQQRQELMTQRVCTSRGYVRRPAGCPCSTATVPGLFRSRVSTFRGVVLYANGALCASTRNAKSQAYNTSVGLAAVCLSVCLSRLFSKLYRARGAYSTWLARGQHATRPSYISARVLRGRTYLLREVSRIIRVGLQLHPACIRSETSQHN